MRFRISTILWITGIVAVFFGISFLAPFIVTAVTLGFSMCISPAAWVSGAAFARGTKRAFFVGGLASATVPHAISIYYMYMVMIGAFQNGWDSLLNIASEDLMMARVSMVTIWLVPGIFAVSGGILAVISRWLVMPKPDSAKLEDGSQRAPRLESLDYQVVSGRLSTVTFDQAIAGNARAQSACVQPCVTQPD